MRRSLRQGDGPPDAWLVVKPGKEVLVGLQYVMDRRKAQGLAGTLGISSQQGMLEANRLLAVEDFKPLESNVQLITVDGVANLVNDRR